MPLSTNLKAERKRRGLTQKQIAEVLGVKRESISQYENGEYKPSVDTLIALADVLQCSLDSLCDRQLSNSG